jgi:hypothetical protein
MVVRDAEYPGYARPAVEIAAHAGLHYGTVSKIIKAWEATR